MSKLPGITARHAIITPRCRTRGQDVAWNDAVARLRREYDAICEARGDTVNLHLALTMELLPEPEAA